MSSTVTIPDVETTVKQIMESDVTYFPVRHHSPIIATHLKELIHEKKPKLILIEMTTSAEWLIKHIVDNETRPPIAIYSFFLDKKNAFNLNGVLSPSEEVPAKFDSWSPLLAYSPEYVAMKEGTKIKADIKFIDLPFRDLIQFKFNETTVPKDVTDEGLYSASEYVDALLKKFNFRDEKELWDYLELQGCNLTTKEFLKIIYYYCAVLRSGVPKEVLDGQGTFLREQFMRQCIDEALETHDPKDILVVTGSFHSIALPFTKTGKKIKIKVDPAESTLIPFSYFQMSDMAGYASGNPAPKYYQRLWEHVEKNKKCGYTNVGSQVLVDIMNLSLEKGEILSMADTIGAVNNARNLAHMRSKSDPTRVEILDAIDLNYMRGREPDVARNVTESTFDIMVGSEVGRVTKNLGKLAIIEDFYQQIKKLRLPLEEGKDRAIKLDMYKEEAHKKKSHFLHQLFVLNVPYCTYVKGPDISTGKDLHLISEQWKVSYKSTGCESALTDLAAFGATVEACAIAKMKEEISKVKTETVKYTMLMLKSAQMGLKDLFNDLLKDALAVVGNENDFVALVKSLYNFIVLYKYRGVTITKNHALMLDLVERTYFRACIQISTITNAKDEEIKDVIDAIRALIQAQLTFKDKQLDKAHLVRFIKASITLNIEATIHGALVGGLHLMKEVTEDDILQEFNQYSLGTIEQFQQAGKFLEGVLLISKMVLLTSDKMIRTFNDLVRLIQWEDFKKIIPNIRRAFKVFTNREILDLSKKIAILLGFQEEISMDTLAVTTEVIEIFKKLDKSIMEIETRWGLTDEEVS